MRVIIKNNYAILSEWIAYYIMIKINMFNPTKDKPFVIGLPTGSSPLGIYKTLIKYYNEGRISFKNVITFNMDEYVGLSPNHPESYYYYMHMNFFNHIDIPKENINLLDGCADNLINECERYENKIKKVGGINLFLGGVGTNGHIAFNEPGSSLSSRTRIKTLSDETIVDNSRFFDLSIEKVPTMTLTVGLGTIMDADEVVIIINGAHKANALKHPNQSAKKVLLLNGIHREWGARPIRRIIQDDIENVISYKYLSGEIKENSTIYINGKGLSLIHI